MGVDLPITITVLHKLSGVKYFCVTLLPLLCATRKLVGASHVRSIAARGALSLQIAPILGYISQLCSAA
jgi:heme A synthase